MTTHQAQAQVEDTMLCSEEEEEEEPPAIIEKFAGQLLVLSRPEISEKHSWQYLADLQATTDILTPSYAGGGGEIKRFLGKISDKSLFKAFFFLKLPCQVLCKPSNVNYYQP